MNLETDFQVTAAINSTAERSFKRITHGGAVHENIFINDSRKLELQGGSENYGFENVDRAAEKYWRPVEFSLCCLCVLGRSGIRTRTISNQWTHLFQRPS